MPHPERGFSSDGERHIKHRHSVSSDKLMIPMWDSSDPDRAPPPLPLNPNSPVVPSRAGTSSAIASAHAALMGGPKESSFVPPATRRHQDSSERASVNSKMGSHKRLQSVNVRGIQQNFEHNSGPNVQDHRHSYPHPSQPQPHPHPHSHPHPHPHPHPHTSKSHERLQYRPSTPPATRETHFENRIYENREATHSTPTLPSSVTPIVRPVVRRPVTQASILGENTPPQSSTMLALQNLGSGSPTKESGEPPLSNITNNQRNPATMENLSAQIMALTGIAQSLQREMAALSRRSRDNATDLLSLKEATNTRDEDIRKSLRDLLGNIHDQSAKLAQRDSFGSYYLDNRPHATSPTSGRTYHIPRVSSPKSFAESLDGASISTPSLVGGDNSSMVLLEKILRGLGTRDGQESLVSQLQELSEKLAGMATAAKVDELVSFIRSQSSETAIVPLNSGNGYYPRRVSFDESNLEMDPRNPMAHRLLKNGDSRGTSEPSSGGKGASLLNEDVITIIRSVKDSVAQSGGLTAEVKSLVRELRGEVLGMGRELGKRLENIARRPMDDTDSTTSASRDEVSRVIDEGLEQMKEQLSHVLREHRRHTASAEKNKNVFDYQEMYNALRNALKDNGSVKGAPDLNREDVMEAVREAWENYKPDIEVQQVGLGREEVLECLKQGFQEYESRHHSLPGASRDEVFTAVVDGLKHFVPPQVDTPASLSRDEIMDAVRECLEEFEFPLAPSTGGDLTREDMVFAVKEGLNDLDLLRSNALVPASNGNNSNKEVIARLHDMMETLKLEFSIISQNNKENATNGGLERLRVAMEGYIDQVAGVAGQNVFMSGLLKTMEGFKEEVSNLVTQANSKSREQLQTELEGLRDIVNSSMVPALPSLANLNSEEILETLRNGLSSLHKEIMRPRPDTTEILDALNEGLSDIRTSLDKISNKPGDLTANDEILDALNDGLKSVKSEIETIRDTSNDRAITAWHDPSKELALVSTDVIKHDDIKNLEILITQLRKTVEVIEPDQQALHKSDLVDLEEMLRSIQSSVEEIKSQSPPTPAPAPAPAAAAAPVPAESKESPQKSSAKQMPPKSSEEPAVVEPSAYYKPPSSSSVDMPSREDVEAIETIVRNTKSRLDDFFDGEQTVRKEHIDNVEALLLETRETMRSLNGQVETNAQALSSLSGKDDVSNLVSLITKLSDGLDEVKGDVEKEFKNPDKVTKHDVESVEAVALEIKAAVEGLASMDLSRISTKDDFGKLEAVLRDAKQTFVAYNDSSSRATNERNAEIGGVSERVADVKKFLEEFKTELEGKLLTSSNGYQAMQESIKAMGEKIEENKTVGTDVKEMFDLMKSEFEISKEALGGSRIEANEKLEQATENIQSRIDDKVGELLAKYDQLFIAIDEKGQAAEARDVLTESAISSNKAVTEELKLLIDTLGSTVTESLDKMEEASKTVFTRVEELSARADEQHTQGKTEHEQTRSQVKEALTAVETLHYGVGEVQPQILETVKNILRLVDDHFEHSKTSARDLQGKIEAQPTSESMQALIPQPDKFDDSMLQEKLDHLIENRYDDSEVHEKLNKIVAHGETVTEVFGHFETLDKVHESVVRSAAELAEFIAAQMQHNSVERDDREKTLQETTLALGKAQTEKDAVELTVLRLRDEEEQLRKSIHSLRIENESLIKQRTRLTGDVSSLETALRLRKEELFEMEHRAETLERRIVNGIMDHSRVLVYGKAGKNGAEAMNRKRVKKPAADEDEESVKSSSHPAIAIALASGGPAGSFYGGAGRRIASLSHVSEKQSTSNIQRSHSAKVYRSNNAHRGRSWAGSMGLSDLVGEDKDIVNVGERMEEIDEVEASHFGHTKGDHGTAAEQESSGPGADRIADDEAGELGDEDEIEEHVRRSPIGEEIDDGDEVEEDIDEFAAQGAEPLRRVSEGTTMIANETMGTHDGVSNSSNSVYEESIDGDDDDAVLLD